MTFKVLYIDTNVFLHYQFFAEIDWLSIAEAKGVEIRLAAMVIHELDIKKDQDSSTKIRSRAMRVIKKFGELLAHAQGFKANLKPSVDIYFETQEILVKEINNNLSSNSQDDKILASILWLKNQDSNLSIALVTNDFGLKTKAKLYNIETINLPESLRLSIEDENEKKIKQLEKELLELKRAIPELKLGITEYDNDKTITSYIGNIPLNNRVKLTVKNLIPSNFDLDSRINKFMEQIREKYTKMLEIKIDYQSSPLTSSLIPDALGSNNLEILPNEIIRYNTMLDDFYLEYENYLRNEINRLDRRSKTFVLEIIIYNTGTCPADDIDVFMHFPDGFSLCRLSDLPRKQEEPEPPEKPIPRTRQDRVRNQLLSMSLPSLPSMPTNIQNLYPIKREKPNVSSPNIRKSNSYDVEYTIKKLKHNSAEYFDPLIITFDSNETINSFCIDYKINAANVPKTVSGSLHVILDKQSEKIDGK